MKRPFRLNRQYTHKWAVEHKFDLRTQPALHRDYQDLYSSIEEHWVRLPLPHHLRIVESRSNTVVKKNRRSLRFQQHLQPGPSCQSEFCDENSLHPPGKTVHPSCDLGFHSCCRLLRSNVHTRHKNEALRSAGEWQSSSNRYNKGTDPNEIGRRGKGLKLSSRFCLNNPKRSIRAIVKRCTFPL